MFIRAQDITAKAKRNGEQRWCRKVVLLVWASLAFYHLAMLSRSRQSLRIGEISERFATLSIATEDAHEWGDISEDLVDKVEEFDEQADTKIIDTLEDWVEARKQSLGIQASFAGIFSGSVHFEHEVRTQKTSNEHFINTYTTVSRAIKGASIAVETFLDRQNSPELKGRLLNLTDEKSHWDFFRQFGTHYLCSFKSGGKLILSATLKTHEISEKEKEDLKIDLSASFAYKLFSAGRSASFEFHNEANYKKHVSDSMTQLHVLGGNPEFLVDVSDLEHAEKSRQAFQKWVHSIKDAPVTISQRFCPLGDYFSTRGEFARAADFLKHLKNFLIACPSSDSSSSCSENGLCDFNTFRCTCVGDFHGQDCSMKPIRCENATRFVPETSYVGLLHPDGSGSYYDICKTKSSGECNKPAADAFCIAKGHPKGASDFKEQRAMVDTKTFDGVFKPAKQCQTGQRCIHCCHCLIRKRRRYQPIMQPCNYIFTSIDCKGNTDCKKT